MKTRPRTTANSRSGFTYIELVASSVVVGILCTGIGSVLFLASETMYSSQNVVSQRATASEIASDLSENLAHAITFTSRSSKNFIITVPDRTGDGMPDKVAYSWSGMPGEPLMFSFNGGPETAISNDVHGFHLDYQATQMLGLKPPPSAGSAVLMVVSDIGFLTMNESERKTLIESWGYAVNLIDDNDTQVNFDAAFVENDVVYVSNDVDESTLAGKLNGAAIGVVNEKGAIADTLGFCLANPPSISNKWMSIVTNDHYITEEFPTSVSIDVLTNNQTLQALSTGDSGAASVLGNTLELLTVYKVLLTLEPGDGLAAGGEAAGRRVHLPWGNVSLTLFTGEGISLLKRSIEWGAGAGVNSPRKDLLMVVHDPANLTPSELAQKLLFQDWNYKVALISENESQGNFTIAAAESDVIYVTANVDEKILSDKLRIASTGVVNASDKMCAEFGFSDDNGSKFKNVTSIDTIEKRHYITFPFAMGASQIFTNQDVMSTVGNSTGSSELLANVDGTTIACLATLEAGQSMRGKDSDPAPARRVFLPFCGISDFNNLNTNGRFLLQRSLEWAAGAEMEIPEALLVVRTAGSLNADENDRLQTFESLGYVVTQISDHDNQTNFDAALAGCDVVYVCETIDSAMLAGKLNATSVGVVNGNRGMIVNLGFSSSQMVANSAQINLTANDHYITEVFPNGPLSVFVSAESVKYLTGNKAPGLQSLGCNPTSANQNALAVINAGDPLIGGAAAAGRRVSLPWGEGLTWNNLSANGHTLFERSLRWAGGEGDGGTPDSSGNKVGYEAVFANGQSGVGDQQVAMQITLNEASMFTSINGYVFRNKKIRYAVYTDEGGEPGNLLVESNNLGGSNGPEWRQSDLPPNTLPAGTYWLAFALEDNLQKYYYQDDPAQQVRTKSNNAIGNGFLGSWGTSDASFTRRISLYGTYTAE